MSIRPVTDVFRSVSTSRNPGAWNRFRKNAASLTFSAWFGIVTLILILGFVALGPFIVPGYDPKTQSLGRADLGFFATAPDGSFHLFGTDPLGIDTLSQLIYGGQISLLIAFSATLISAVVGPIFGVLAGYFGGFVDKFVTVLIDLQLAVPRILIMVTVVAVFGPSVPLLILLIGLLGWAGFARVVRAQTVTLKTREFVEAAISMGSGRLRILLTHIVPHTVNAIIVMATLELGQVVVIEAALSYLGLGVRPPETSWGLMIQEGQDFMQTSPRLLLLPSAALVLLVLSSNLVARLFTSEASDSRRSVVKKTNV